MTLTFPEATNILLFISNNYEKKAGKITQKGVV